MNHTGSRPSQGFEGFFARTKSVCAHAGTEPLRLMGQAVGLRVSLDTVQTAEDEPAAVETDPDVPFAILVCQAGILGIASGRAGWEGMPLLPVVNQHAPPGHP